MRGGEESVFRRWRHSPPHLFLPDKFYVVTGATLYKRAIFNGDERLRLLVDALFDVTGKYGWTLQAWAVFPNHYHFVAQAPETVLSLQGLIRRLHSFTAVRVNEMDRAKGRRVWFQCRDSCLSDEKAYHASLNYVQNNAVKHGVAPEAGQYLYCSASCYGTFAATHLSRRFDMSDEKLLRIRDDF